MRARTSVAVGWLLALAAAVAANPAPAGAERNAPPTSRANGWHQQARISGLRYDRPLVASSVSNVTIAVAPGAIAFDTPDPDSVLLRRLPNGHVARRTQQLGDVLAVDVNHGGRSTVVGRRGDNLIVIFWPKDEAGPKKAIIELVDPAGTVDVEMLVDGRGDLALVVHESDGTVRIMRRPNTSSWLPWVTVPRARYHGVLDDVSIGRSGQLTGAFRTRAHVVSLRTLPLGGTRFGPKRKAISWPHIEEVPGVVDEFATVNRGPFGDLLATLTYTKIVGPKSGPSRRADEASWQRAIILPATGRAWRHYYDRGDEKIRTPVVMGADGSVTTQFGIDTGRWERRGRVFAIRKSTFLKASSVRGDALIGSGTYRGSVGLWPIGKHPGRARALPRGDTFAWAVTEDGLASIVVRPKTGPRGYFLFARDLNGA